VATQPALVAFPDYPSLSASEQLFAGSEAACAPAIISMTRGPSTDYKFKKGDILSETFSEPDQVFVILNGAIALYKNRTVTNCQITHLAFRNSVIGLVKPPHKQDYVALTPTTIRAFPLSSYLSLKTSHPDFSNKLINGLSDELSVSESHDHSFMVGRLDSLAAVAAFISFMRKKQSMLTEVSADTDIILLILNRHEIADYLGLTFETVSRAFSELKKMGIIAFSNSKEITLLNQHSLKVLHQTIVR